MKKICALLLVMAMFLALGGTCFADGLYCRNCGKSISADSRFCQYCGTAVISTAENSNGKAEKLVVTEKKHVITVRDSQKNDIWICDTKTNLITGDPSLEFYAPHYLHNDEIQLYLFQFCSPKAFTEEAFQASARDSSNALSDWFNDSLGGENRTFSITGSSGGFILVLHSDKMLTPERYPFYGTVFCCPLYEDVELFWCGPFDSMDEAMENPNEYFAALFPVEIEDGEFYCLGVWCSQGSQWLKTEGSLFVSSSSKDAKGCVTINSQNWSDYFDLVEDIEDTSLKLDGAGIYSCKLHTRLRLKDSFSSRIDASRSNAVEFSVQYKECMGLFSFRYNADGSIKSVKDPDSFSTVKSAKTANYSYRFPEENSVSEIPVPSILAGSSSDSAIGRANRYVEVLSASGTLYFK